MRSGPSRRPPADLLRFARFVGTERDGSLVGGCRARHLLPSVRDQRGLEASVYLKTALLDPIGVGPVAYKLTKGMGTVKYAAAGNALMTARDFMRVGHLMLHEGDWEGNRIFPASWLQHFTESTAYINMRSNRDCYWGTGESLARLFAAVTELYVACDGTLVNGDAS